MNQELRWVQRFSNFQRGLDKLTQAVDYIKANFLDKENSIDEGSKGFVLDEMIKEGLIQRFEYTHELAWNVMKDYAKFQGNNSVAGSRDATREAFQMKLISNGKVWMDMIGSRNKTTHTYNEDTANEIFSKIMNDYYPAFLEFKKNMDILKNKNQDI